MVDRYRIALAQLNPVMGDIAGNLRRAREARARATGADVILFSELFIVGYSPEDLVLKPALQQDARAAVEELAKDTADGGPAILIGTPWVEHGELYNAVALLDGGKVRGLTFKDRAAQLWRVRREARLRAGTDARTADRARREAGHSDLRGYLEAGCHHLAGRCGRGNSACPTARPSRPARRMCG